MRIKSIINFILILIVFSPHFVSGLECPINVAYEDWENLTPYFLPDDHPVKKSLDKLFATQDVLENEATLKRAGFRIKAPSGYSKIFVLKHKKLKKHLIKAFTDDQIKSKDWHTWVRRIQGAKTIEAAIFRHGFEHWFKVPKKWIYQVPRKQENFEEKNFVLVVEDMQLFDERGNAIIWYGQEFVTKEKLKALYTLAEEEGLIDSLYIKNIPFSVDQKIAFVDTEYVHRWPVAFKRFTPFLANELQPFWLSLIK